MAFVRHKVVKGRKYYQYVRNYREAGRHKQEVLCHLGPHQSSEEAMDYSERMLLLHTESAAKLGQEAAETKGYLLEFHGDVLDGRIPSEGEAFDMYMSGTFFPVDDEEGPRWTPRTKHELRLFRTRWKRERELLRMIYEYHDTMRLAAEHQRLADRHRADLNKFIAAKQNYS